MKIGIVCVNLSFVAGGPRLVLGLARSLQAMGNTVIIYAHDFDAEYYKEPAAGLDIRVIKTNHPIDWHGKPKGFFAWVLRKWRQERQFIESARSIAEAMDSDFDIVNIHDFSYRTGFFYKKKNAKAKVIWTENAPPTMYLSHGNVFFDALGWLYELVKKFSSRKYFDAIDTVSVLDFYNQRWCQKQGLKNIVIVRAGIDFDKFYAPVKDFTARAEAKKIQLLALGALNSYRRYDVVVRAVRLLRDWGYDATALIIANNIWNEDACMRDLIALAKELNMSSFVDYRFRGVSEEDLKRAYREADVFVQAVFVPPPGNHGWGLVNFEAMSAGLPVILSRSATATEVLTENKQALFFDPLSFEQVAQKAKSLVDDPASYFRIASEGQAFTKQHMSWEKYAQDVLKLFQQ